MFFDFTPISQRYVSPSDIVAVNALNSAGEYVLKQETIVSNMNARGIAGSTYVQNNLFQRNGLTNGVDKMTIKNEKHMGIMTSG